MAQTITPTPAPILSGPQKAAVLMLTMGEQRSAQILPQLTEDELGILTQAMSGIGTIKATVVEGLFTDFSIRAAPAIQSAATRSRIAPAAQAEEPLTIWDKLACVSPQVLAGYLVNEHPQAAAVVMRKLPPDVAARVLGELPEDFAGEVVARISQAEPIRREVLANLEETLKEELGADLEIHGMKPGPAHLKSILSHMTKPVGRRFIGAAQATDGAAAQVIKSAVINFDDLRELSGRDVRRLFDGISPETVATALKGASETVQEFIVSNMPPRAAKILRQEIEQAGPTKLRAVDDAQLEILERAKSLADRGDVVMPARRAA